MSEPVVVAGRVEPAGGLLAYPEGRVAEIVALDAPVAVCLVVRDGGEGLDGCLSALEALDGSPPVVLVDDGSRDWSYALAARFAARHGRAVALRPAAPPDFARALRAAAALTGSEHVLLCGAGDVLAPDAVLRLGSALADEPLAVLAAGGGYVDGLLGRREVAARGPAEFDPSPVLAPARLVAAWPGERIEDERAARWALQTHLLSHGDVAGAGEPVSERLPAAARPERVDALARAGQTVLAGDPLPPEVAGALGRRLAAAHAGSGPRADRALAPLGRAIASAATAADPARARGVAVEPGGGCVDDIDALLATLGAPVTRGGRGDGEMTVLRFHGGGWPEHRVGRLAPGAAIVEAPAGVDALWAPDEATRQACVAAGADPARVAVVPTPVDPGLFARQGPAVDLGEARSARFLAFADAPGWQAALRAFVQGFEPEADASLVLAAAGPAGLDQEAVVAAIVGVVEGELGRSIDAIPDVVLRPAPMAPDERAGLYRAVDCVVGLPEGRREAIEAALCGRAVVEPGAMADAVSDAQRGAAVRAAALERHSPRLLRRHPAVLQALGEAG